MASAEVQAESRRFEPAPGRSVIYVIRLPAAVGFATNVIPTVDGMTLTPIPPKCYAAVMVEPGVHAVAVLGNRRPVTLEVDAEEGEVHFVGIRGGVGGASVTPLTDREGREYVLKYRMVERI